MRGIWHTCSACGKNRNPLSSKNGERGFARDFCYSPFSLALELLLDAACDAFCIELDFFKELVHFALSDKTVRNAHDER